LTDKNRQGVGEQAWKSSGRVSSVTPDGTALQSDEQRFFAFGTRVREWSDHVDVIECIARRYVMRVHDE
jgi:hypothetical protein